MLKNSGISRVVRHCTSRFITQRTPCKITGVFPRFVSAHSGPDCRVIRPNGPISKAAKYSLQPNSARSGLIRRSLQTSSQKNPNDNVVLLVGLGSIGLASALIWKMGLFSVVGPSTSTGKGEVTSDAVEESTQPSDVDIPADPEPSIVSTEIDEETVLVELVSENPEEQKAPEEDAGESNGNGEVLIEGGETTREVDSEVEQPIAENNEKVEEINDEVNEEIKKELNAEVKEEVKEEITEVVKEVIIEAVEEEIKQESKEQIEKPAESDAIEKQASSQETELKDSTEEAKPVVEDPGISKIPSKPEAKRPKIPTYAPYLIIGAGTASHAACRAIRKNDPTAKILVIGDEEVLPYMRPPLSKELWFNDDEDTADALFFKQWNGKQRTVFFEDDTYYTKPHLLLSKPEAATAVLTGHRVVRINPKDNVVYLKHGEEIKYDKLLIATGGHPKNHSVFENASDELKNKFTLFRTVADYRKLDKHVSNTDSVAVIGGGFLGSELACALAAKSKKNGMEVSQIYHEDGNMGKILPKYLSEWTTTKVKSEGVTIHSNVDVANAAIGENDKVVLELSNGESITAGHVVVCVGIEPNIELADSAGLELDPDHGGFRVNSELQAKSDIWIAGDVSCFYDEKLGRRRVEHHDHAVVSGRLAGENMAGAKKSYTHQSMFWSDLGPNVGYEAIGIVDNSLDTVGVWAKATEHDTPKAVVEKTGESIRSESEQDAETGETPMPIPAGEALEDKTSGEEFGKGVVFYLRDNIVVGVLLWNVFNRMPVARKILKEGRKQNDLTEIAKLFNIHE